MNNALSEPAIQINKIVLYLEKKIVSSLEKKIVLHLGMLGFHQATTGHFNQETVMPQEVCAQKRLRDISTEKTGIKFPVAEVKSCRVRTKRNGLISIRSLKVITS